MSTDCNDCILPQDMCAYFNRAKEADALAKRLEEAERLLEAVDFESGDCYNIGGDGWDVAYAAFLKARP